MITELFMRSQSTPILPKAATRMSGAVTNAQSAMEDGGTITVRTEDDPDEMRISVHDTGSGIPEAILDKIFEPFFTTKQIGKGTGLGLAVTYGIIKMHSGDVQVESNEDPGEGPTWTRFTVKVPRREVAEPVRNTESDSQLLGNTTL